MHAITFALAAFVGCTSGESEARDTADTAAATDTGDTADTDTGVGADTADDTDTDTADDCLAWWYPDADGDGYGVYEGAVEACEAPAGSVATEGDCDDARDDVHPGAVDVCGNDEDEDCDGLVEACPGAVDVTLEEADGAVSMLRIAGNEGRPVSTLGDVDGDGLDDFGVGIADGSGRALAVFARLEGLVDASDASATWDDSVAYRRWAVLDPVGDLTGLGAPTLALGSHDGVYLWETPIAAGALGAADRLLTDDDGNELTHLPEDLVGPGDVDGDGYDDLVASSVDTSTYGDHPEFTYIFRGPIEADRAISAADTLIEGEEGGGKRGTLAPLGDHDGDGLADFGILVDDEAVYVHGGDVSGAVDREGDHVGVVRLDAGDGVARGGPADLDGDGYQDLVVFEQRSGRAVAFRGPLVGAHAEDEDAWATWSGLGYAVASLGDTDGDGADDLLLMTDPGGGDPKGHLFTGIVAGSLGSADARAMIRGHGTYDVWHVAAAGDHDGDGLADYLVGGRRNSESVAFLALFHGE